MVICDGCGVQCFSDLCCPKCMEYDKKSFFCTQLCFDTSWRNHNKTHKLLLEKSKRPQNNTETNTHLTTDMSIPSYTNETSGLKDRIIHRSDPEGRQEHLTTNFTDINISREGLDTNRTNNIKADHPIDTTVHTLSALDNIESLKIYDPESNVLGAGKHVDQGNVTKWLVDAAAKLSNTLNMTENLHNINVSKFNMDKRIYQSADQLMNSSKSYSSYRFKRRFRQIIITLVFSFILFLSFVFSTKLVDIIDDRIAKKFNTISTFGPDENAVDKFIETTEELRKEILKLREQVYKNAVAINGLTDGAYKVSGSDDSAKQFKKNKFDRNGTMITLNNNASSNQNINRQDITSNIKKDGQELDATSFVPDAIEYDANITQQF